MNNKIFCGTFNDSLMIVVAFFKKVLNSSAVSNKVCNWYLVYKNSAGAEADLALIEK
jgi:hypothetical protein